MSFGGGAPATPKAEPAIPVPQENDPKGIEAQRKAAVVAGNQDGYTAHLLTGEAGVQEDPDVKKKTLTGTY
jgi:hypothetical protein